MLDYIKNISSYKKLLFKEILFQVLEKVLRIVIGLIVIIYTIVTDNINWFYVKVWIPVGVVWILLWNWLDLL